MVLGRGSNGHAALEGAVVIHEYVHGVTQRMIGGVNNTLGIVRRQPQALAEAWSDFFAITIQNYYRLDHGLIAEEYMFAAWCTGGTARTRSYDGHLATFASAGSGAFSAAHNAGEIWAAAAIDFARRVVAHFGFRHGYPIAWSAMFESFRGRWGNPTFLDARDALFGAIAARPEAGVILPMAREAFRIRGMGRNASAPDADRFNTKRRELRPLAVRRLTMRLKNIYVLFAFALIAPVVAAQDERGRPWQFYWENDIGVFTEGTDQYYTNGLRLSVGLKEDEEPQKVRDFRDWYCRRSFQPCRRMESGEGRVVESLAFALTHQFWTPQVKTIAEPQPFDRPWAGYMYVSAIVQIVDDTAEKEQHLIEAQVGILGPGAGAAYVQTKWHELINSAKPLGWSNQLVNEPVLNLVYVQNRRVWTRGDNADLIVSPGGILGTLFTYPSLGFTARAGWNISGFPAMPLAPSAGSARARRSQVVGVLFSRRRGCALGTA